MVALLIGGTTGFAGGRVDIYAQRFVDAWMSFPGLLLLLTIMSIAGRGVAQIILVLGVAGGIPTSRAVRGAVIGLKENAYFQAAEATGARTLRTLVRHVLPNIAAPLIVVFSINVGSVIIAEASLSFLGFGLPATVPSWGGMLSREGRQYMEIAPRLALWPGPCLTVTVYALNLFGDAVRDLLDPRLRGAAGRYGGGRRPRPRAAPRLTRPACWCWRRRCTRLDKQAGHLYRVAVPEELPMIYETTYSNARAHLASLMDQVTDTREPILIRRRGAESVALVAADELAGWMETAYLLRSPKNAQRLLDGNRRAAAGEGTPLSIEQLRERLGLEGT